MNSQGQRVKSEKATRFQSAWIVRAAASIAALLGVSPHDARVKAALGKRTKHSAARSAPNGHARAKRVARRAMAARSRHVNERRRFAMRHK